MNLHQFPHETLTQRRLADAPHDIIPDPPKHLQHILQERLDHRRSSAASCRRTVQSNDRCCRHQANGPVICAVPSKKTLHMALPFLGGLPIPFSLWTDRARCRIGDIPSRGWVVSPVPLSNDFPALPNALLRDRRCDRQPAGSGARRPLRLMRPIPILGICLPHASGKALWLSSTSSMGTSNLIFASVSHSRVPTTLVMSLHSKANSGSPWAKWLTKDSTDIHALCGSGLIWNVAWVTLNR